MIAPRFGPSSTSGPARALRRGGGPARRRPAALARPAPCSAATAPESRPPCASSPHRPPTHPSVRRQARHRPAAASGSSARIATAPTWAPDPAATPSRASPAQRRVAPDEQLEDTARDLLDTSTTSPSHNNSFSHGIPTQLLVVPGAFQPFVYFLDHLRRRRPMGRGHLRRHRRRARPRACVLVSTTCAKPPSRHDTVLVCAAVEQFATVRRDVAGGRAHTSAPRLSHAAGPTVAAARRASPTCITCCRSAPSPFPASRRRLGPRLPPASTRRRSQSSQRTWTVPVAEGHHQVAGPGATLVLPTLFGRPAGAGRRLVGVIGGQGAAARAQASPTGRPDDRPPRRSAALAAGRRRGLPTWTLLGITAYAFGPAQPSAVQLRRRALGGRRHLGRRSSPGPRVDPAPPAHPHGPRPDRRRQHRPSVYSLPTATSRSSTTCPPPRPDRHAAGQEGQWWRLSRPWRPAHRRPGAIMLGAIPAHLARRTPRGRLSARPAPGQPAAT